MFEVAVGATDVTIYVYFMDDDGGTAPGEPTTGLAFGDIETGGSASTMREGAARADLTLITQTVAGAHSDGGFIEVDATNMPGVYRLDLPDVFATGAEFVIVHLVAEGTNNSITRPVVINILENPAVNVTQWEGTAVASPNTAGVPLVDQVRIVGGLVPTPTTTGVPDTNVERWLDTLVTLSGALPDVNVEAMDASSIAVGVLATDAIAAGSIAAAAMNGKGDWNIGKTGYSLAATGLDAIASTALGMIEIAKAVWDRVLTGATHNISESAGRRLRITQESGSYALGHVYIDTVNGTAGTTNFENGVDILPTDLIASVNTILASVGLSRVSVSPNSLITFAAAQQNQEFHGEQWTLALGGQAVGGSHFTGANVSGTGTCASEAHFEHCELGTMTIGVAHFDDCDVEGTITLSDAAIYRFFNCSHSGATVIDFGAAVGSTTVHIHHYTGALTIENLGATGTDVLHFDSPGGQLTLAASCVGGTLNLRGTVELINNGSGITINRGGDIINDVAGVQADADDIQTRLPASLVGGAMDSDVSAFQAGAITAAAIATDAIDADALALDAVNEIRDAILPKSNTALDDIPFVMVLSSDHVSPATGLTVVATRSIDGGTTFSATTGTVTEATDGVYHFDASAADMNGALVTFKFTSATADDTFVSIRTGG